MTKVSHLPSGRAGFALSRHLPAFAALAVLLFASLSASPAPQTSKPPRITIAVEKYSLPNGLEVILHEDHNLPIVAVNTWYHVGPANETPGRTGFAHLFEHMMFQSSGHVGEDQFIKYIEGAGASFINGSTSFDRTNYMEDLPSNQLEIALWLESDRMGFLLDRITETSLANQRDVVRNERRESIESQPYGIVEEELMHRLFPKGHPYYASIIGSHEDIQAANLADVRDFFKQYYCPNNASLVITGDFDKAKVKALVQKYYGTIPRGQDVPPITATTPPITEERRVTVTDKVELPKVSMAWITPPIFKPGDAEADVAADILGGGKSSRLYKSLVYEKQIAQSVSAYQQSFALGSVFEIEATAKPGHTAEELEAAIDAELAKLATEGPTPAEVAATQNSIYSNTISSIEHIGGDSGIADRLNSYNQHVHNPDFVNQDLARYAAITPEAVKRFAVEQLARDHRVVVYGLPGEKKLPPDPETPPAPPKEEAKIESQEPWRNTVPQAGPAPQAKLPMPKRFTMPNGLTVFLVEQHKLPVVSATLAVRSGSAQDPAGLPGLASFAATMLDEGTSTRDALGIANELHGLGASLGTGSSLDGSSISCRSLKQTSSGTLAIFSDVALNPSFPEKDLERVRNDRITSLVQQRDNPNQIAGRVLWSCLYGPTHPYGHQPVGTQESLTKISRDEIVGFYKSTYTPRNAALVLVGDLTEAEAKKLANEALGAWKGPATEASRPQAGVTIASRVVIVDKPGSPQTALRVGQIGLMRSDPDFEKMDIANSVLGGLFSSRINLNLREEHGYTYGAFSALVGTRGQGPIFLGAGVRTDVTGASIEEILKEVRGIRERPITAEELKLAKDSNTRSLPAYFETTGSSAGTIANIYLYDLPLDYYQTLPGRIAAMTQADVQATANKCYAPDRMLVVAVGDRAKIEPQIEKLKLGQVAFRDLDGKEVPATN